MTKVFVSIKDIHYDKTKWVDTRFSLQDADMLSFRPPFKDPNVYTKVNRLFKNQKAFFEKGERDILKARLEELLKTDASIYLGKERELLERWTDQWIDSEAEGLRQHLLKESLNQIASERTLLQGTEQLGVWRSVYEKLQAKELV
jgi:hypothetical protein